MNLWFIDNPQRMLSERNGVADLQAHSNWLTGVFWGFDASGLYCDATIRAHDHDYNIRLTYPAFFPDTPPSVAPREQGERWSPHQYGAGGTLCLEWGPDNWQPGVTGAHLLESAFRLLYEENPLGNSSVVVSTYFG